MPSARILLFAGLATMTITSCADPICDLVLTHSVRVDVRTNSFHPAAAGARLIVTADGVVDTGRAAPDRDAVVLFAGETAAPWAKVRIEKPWYEPFEDIVRLNLDECSVSQPVELRVRLTLVDNAPPVRSVYVGHGAPIFFTGCHSMQLSAYADVATGLTDSVLWHSTDTTVATVDAGGLLRTLQINGRGHAYVIARSVVDTTVRDSLSISVLPGSFGCSANE